MSTDFIDFVANTLEPQVFPVYRTDYPKARKSTDPYPRAAHGCLHISRCLIYSEAMMSCYERTFNVAPSRFDKLAIRLALAWHDAGREDDGVDLWEGQSALMAGDYAQAQGLSVDFAHYVGSLIVHEQRDARDPNAHLVQACDTLDVQRVYRGRAFERARLAFLHPTGDPCVERVGAQGRSIREQLIAEADAFIQQTEGWQVGPRLMRSSTPCQDMVHLVGENRTKLPTLASLLDHILTQV
jgi:hypothetical protein